MRAVHACMAQYSGQVTVRGGSQPASSTVVGGRWVSSIDAAMRGQQLLGSLDPARPIHIHPAVNH